MTFKELNEKYMINSSCNIHQLAFVWNATIDECINEIKYKASVTHEPVRLLEKLKVDVNNELE